MHGVDPDKLPTSLYISCEFELPGKSARRQVEAELFAEFAPGTGIVVFPAIEVAGGAGVVTERERVFGGGPFLNEQFRPAIEEEDMDRAMAELLPVNIRAGGLAGHLVEFVDNVKDFGGVLHGELCSGKVGKRKAPRLLGGLL